MFRIAMLAVVALSLAGCLVSSSSTTEHTGSHVSQKTLDQIEPGSKRDYVIALLGEPTTRTELVDQEIWKWEYREEKTSKGAVFLLLSSKSKTGKSGTVYVVFRDGVVVRTWRD